MVHWPSNVANHAGARQPLNRQSVTPWDGVFRLHEGPFQSLCSGLILGRSPPCPAPQHARARSEVSGVGSTVSDLALPLILHRSRHQAQILCATRKHDALFSQFGCWHCRLLFAVFSLGSSRVALVCRVECIYPYPPLAGARYFASNCSIVFKPIFELSGRVHL
ncbi:hypothetical protein BU23DRAFT_75515 [Bimuria novae-zelandiae CBS 107.79]|uniref:Uncharacterized protein n=1 Tax=Bimuria novae-zelandiae CBS 107.79 TaxID=1447943 RepID=A0A6A5VFG1_9PLEO|nr:hypothetical protein BU23DRAFT_75515 [Bimuria novae-zelandiae CBS 107.79]